MLAMGALTVLAAVLAGLFVSNQRATAPAVTPASEPATT
jgi:hypothetical protein